MAARPTAGASRQVSCVGWWVRLARPSAVTARSSRASSAMTATARAAMAAPAPARESPAPTAPPQASLATSRSAETESRRRANPATVAPIRQSFRPVARARTACSTATVLAVPRPAPRNPSAEEQTGPGRPTPAPPPAETVTWKPARNATMATWWTAMAARRHASSKEALLAPQRPTPTPSHVRNPSTAANAWSCRSNIVTSRARRKPTVTRTSSTTGRHCKRPVSSASSVCQASLPP